MRGESTPASPPFYSGARTRTDGGTRGGAVDGPLGFSTRRIDALCGDWTRHRRRIDYLRRRQVPGSRGERMTMSHVHTPTGGARREARAKSRAFFRSRGSLSSGDLKRPPAYWVWVGIVGHNFGPIRRYLGLWGRGWGIFRITTLISPSWRPLEGAAEDTLRFCIYSLHSIIVRVFVASQYSLLQLLNMSIEGQRASEMNSVVREK